MTVEYVLAGSGFMLPDVEFWKINPEANKNIELERAHSYKFKSIHNFPISNTPRPLSMFERTYNEYVSNSSFENWMEMVDVITRVFVEEGSFKEFVSMQVKNPFLSATGFKVALSLLQDSYERNKVLEESFNIPSFKLEEGEVDLTELSTRKDRIRALSVDMASVTDLHILKDLIGLDPKHVAMFYRYVFTSVARRS